MGLGQQVPLAAGSNMPEGVGRGWGVELVKKWSFSNHSYLDSPWSETPPTKVWGHSENIFSKVKSSRFINEGFGLCRFHAGPGL